MCRWAFRIRAPRRTKYQPAWWVFSPQTHQNLTLISGPYKTDFFGKPCNVLCIVLHIFCSSVLLFHLTTCSYKTVFCLNAFWKCLFLFWNCLNLCTFFSSLYFSYDNNLLLNTGNSQFFCTVFFTREIWYNF